MTNELPDVKFENFAAAKSCLQNVLSPLGALVKDLSITEDQNGKANWTIILGSSGNFPAPTLANFVSVRAVLNQHVPIRGVLRQINRICRMSDTEEWFWSVTYGIKKMSRVRRAINQLSAAIATASTCLGNMPKVQTAIRKKERLSALEYEKNRKRFFYNLRHSRKEVKANKYSNFTKGETLIPKETRTTRKVNIKPDYENWDIHRIFFEMKNVTISDAKAMSILLSCKGQPTDIQNFAAAVYHLKNRCPQLTRQQLPLLFKKTVERLSIDEGYLYSISMSSDLFAKISVCDYSYYRGGNSHSLCQHT